jgi:hypothetical protein
LARKKEGKKKTESTQNEKKEKKVLSRSASLFSVLGWGAIGLENVLLGNLDRILTLALILCLELHSSQSFLEQVLYARTETAQRAR